MILVLILSVGSATCAAFSTVLKHLSATKMSHAPTFGGRVPKVLSSMLGSPLWLAGIAVDVFAIALQVFALRYGELTVVQPILTISLVFSLIGSHIAARTRMTGKEIRWAAVLIVGLLVFLLMSEIAGVTGAAAVGSRTPAFVLGGVAIITIVGAVAIGQRCTPVWRAPFYGIAVAALYATTASLIKSCTRIFDTRGFEALALSWQLWLLIGAGAAAMVVAQLAFAAGPLTRSLPVIASLDPIFSLLAGIIVYGETLATTGPRFVGGLVGLCLLIVGVAGLGRLSAQLEEGGAHP